jgi:hypothetical protein
MSIFKFATFSSVLTTFTRIASDVMSVSFKGVQLQAGVAADQGLEIGGHSIKDNGTGSLSVSASVAAFTGQVTVVSTLTVTGEATAAVATSATSLPQFGQVVPITALGAANGVATLDGSSKIPLAQFPSVILTQLKPPLAWNASTNTPTIVSGVGIAGDQYRVTVAGTTTIDTFSDWQSGDLLTFDGTIWYKTDNSEAFGLTQSVTNGDAANSPSADAVYDFVVAQIGGANTFDDIISTGGLIVGKIHNAAVVATGPLQAGLDTTELSIAISSTELLVGKRRKIITAGSGLTPNEAVYMGTGNVPTSNPPTATLTHVIRIGWAQSTTSFATDVEYLYQNA